jgi:hypothetical protein
MATGYELDDLGLTSSFMAFIPAAGPTQPPIQKLPGDIFTGIMRPIRIADHSSPTSAEVENAGAILLNMSSRRCAKL